MPRFVSHCPACQESLRVSRLECPSCKLQLDGAFEIPPLLRLPPDDLAFVLEFVRSSGSLKKMGKLLGQSYPTVRNRLDDIIRVLDGPAQELGQRRAAILDAVERGELSAADAAAALEELNA